MTTLNFTPGIYPGIPEHAYHSRTFGPTDSLSSTEASSILRAPAILRHRRDNPQPPNPTFDLGHVAHALILGEGMGVHVHDHESLRSRAAREEVAQARLDGLVPVSRTDYERMQALADAVLTHPLAAPLLEAGVPEQSVYAVDERTGVWMRGRIDWVSSTEGALVDVKTTRDANPATFHRSVTSYGYDVQAAWYQTLWTLTTGDHPRFLHILVEREAPYMVAVVELDADFLEIGRRRSRQALDTYQRCLDTGDWPGYPTVIHPVCAPDWYADQHLDTDIRLGVA